jgi:HEPN domain-containing protein
MPLRRFAFGGIFWGNPRRHPFALSQPLTEDAARAEAQKHFDYWSEQADSARLGARFYIKSNKPRDAAFLLHQAAERLYHCVLLTLTLYSPKSHKLNFLRGLAEPLVHELIGVWPRDTKFARRCFELLQQAYVNARYSPHYKITPEELEWLAERIELLQKLVKETCEKRLAPRD